MSAFSHCTQCGAKLGSTALFCSQCGQSSCCWKCHDLHVAQHAAAVARSLAGAGKKVVTSPTSLELGSVHRRRAAPG